MVNLEKKCVLFVREMDRWMDTERMKRGAEGECCGDGQGKEERKERAG